MKPRILVSRATFDDALAPLRRDFIVEHNQLHDEQWSPEELRHRLADKDGALISSRDFIDGPVLDAAPRLKIVCNVAVGYNNIDVAACTARGILATNTPGTLDGTTADLAWALMLAAARRLPAADRFIRAHQWQGWKNNLFLGVDVHGATLGIVGMGRVGREVARRAQGFSMKVLYFNRRRLPVAEERALGVKHAPLDRLLRASDFVCLHVPYSAETHHLIGAPQLARMKPTAVLVNLARGGIVDDAALVAALKAGQLAGAGLDVFENEPDLHPGFLELENVALAPHIGSATRATRLRIFNLAVKNLRAALAGRRPPSLLNPAAWPKRRK